MSKTWLNRPRASHEPTHRARSTSSSSLKAAVEAVPEGIVHAQVVGGVALGELGGQALPLAEPAPVAADPDRLVERLGDLPGVGGPAGHVPGGTPVDADGALVDPGHGGPGRLELPEGQRRPLVDGAAVGPGRRGEGRGQLGPHVDQRILLHRHGHAWHGSPTLSGRHALGPAGHQASGSKRPSGLPVSGPNSPVVVRCTVLVVGVVDATRPGRRHRRRRRTTRKTPRTELIRTPRATPAAIRAPRPTVPVRPRRAGSRRTTRPARPDRYWIHWRSPISHSHSSRLLAMTSFDELLPAHPVRLERGPPAPPQPQADADVVG